jgi:hypothetical protein
MGKELEYLHQSLKLPHIYTNHSTVPYPNEGLGFHNSQVFPLGRSVPPLALKKVVITMEKSGTDCFLPLESWFGHLHESSPVVLLAEFCSRKGP